MNSLMMNSIQIQGRLTADAEVRQVSENSKVVNVSIACDRNIPSENVEKKTDFFNVTAWNLPETFITKYLKKGEMVIIVGSLRNNFWEDNEARKHYDYYIEADHIYPIFTKKS